ncbi:amidohydrolase [Amniculicola lignicola CBS 123094]|uniref:Amidohydrolase n=1 Tax=Amniculicola lignicola CBS 123094 TaxID=1392246 RepID=A0A6A5VX45_9PLEO|nr:amidohydrolase [Amniculicola lignicola CBS 123094]
MATMEKDQAGDLPTYSDAVRPWATHRQRRYRRTRVLGVALLTYLSYLAYTSSSLIAGNTSKATNSFLSVEKLSKDYATCAKLRTTIVEPAGKRDQNARWVKSTKPQLIKNATIWTGVPDSGTSKEDVGLGKGYTWVRGDVFTDQGLILGVGVDIDFKTLPKNTEVFNANGRQLTAGIVDMHSHAGLSSVGNLQDDVNELSTDITPFVQSIDGLDPLQPEIEFIKSGGVTTSLILPGSGNNIGGEAFVVKLAVGNYSGRTEISQQDMIAAPDTDLRWLKMACGENPKSVYGREGEKGPFSRLGESWEFRHAFEQAQEYVQSQNQWCTAADEIGAENMATYLPRKLKWDTLGAVLRGHVRVNTHCYTVPDLEAMVRHTNEFQFRVWAFHHAHQTFLVPEVLKRAWGGTPAAALFADNMYYKVEAYTASEQAGKILYRNDITPVYVSDNPVLNSQHVVFEAAKAYGYGLPYHAALAGVTSAPAELLGLGNRVGRIVEGLDADIVVWDSDPLSAGATPVQVWIDGAAQFKDPVLLDKPIVPPITPDPSLAKDLQAKEIQDTIIFTGISKNSFSATTESFDSTQRVVAIVSKGTLLCIGTCTEELQVAQKTNALAIQLQNGHVTPSFTAFGTGLGLVEIDAEDETHDGPPPKAGISRAVDGLTFGGKHHKHAYEHGVTKAISAPTTYSIDSRGISVAFKTGAKNALEKGAVIKAEVALHYVLTLGAKTDNTPSISSAIAVLRGKLLEAIGANDTALTGKDKYDEKSYLKKVVQGEFPLVLSVHSADTIATIIGLKAEIEDAIAAAEISTLGGKNTKVNIILIGGAESHLVAEAIAEAQISVVLAPLFPHAQTWDQRRGLTGAPLTNGTTIDILIAAGVLVGISVEEIWETRDLALAAGIAYANSQGALSFEQAINLVSKNIDTMLRMGIEDGKGEEDMGNTRDWVIWEGSPLEIGGKIRCVGGEGHALVWE